MSEIYLHEDGGVWFNLYDGGLFTFEGGLVRFNGYACASNEVLGIDAGLIVCKAGNPPINVLSVADGGTGVGSLPECGTNERLRHVTSGGNPSWTCSEQTESAQFYGFRTDDSMGARWPPWTTSKTKSVHKITCGVGTEGTGTAWITAEILTWPGGVSQCGPCTLMQCNGDGGLGGAASAGQCGCAATLTAGSYIINLAVTSGTCGANPTGLYCQTE